VRYLITGGAGFIGSHLADHLTRRGDSVILLDDLSAGNLWNVSHLLDGGSEPKATLYVGTVQDSSLVDELVSRVDGIFHLAAVVGMRRVLASPELTVRTHVTGGRNVLSAASRRAVPLLIASSSEVYGNAHAGQLSESLPIRIDPARGPRWAYAWSKARVESFVLHDPGPAQAQAVIARPFNCVGPRQSARYGMVLPTLVGQALRGDDLTVHGDGLQRRSFCHVSDLVDGLVRLLDSPATAGRVYNIGSREEMSILDLARRVIECTGSTSGMKFVPHAEVYGPTFEDVPRRVPDLRRIESAIGWKPIHGVSAAINDLVEEIRQTKKRRPLRVQRAVQSARA